MTQFWIYWLGLLITLALTVLLFYVVCKILSLTFFNTNKVILFLLNHPWILWVITFLLLAFGIFFTAKLSTLQNIPPNITGGGLGSWYSFTPCSPPFSKNGGIAMNELPLDTILQGDTLQVLKTIPSDSIDTIITSPPYWGLRDYGEQTNTIWDGDPNCKHEFELTRSKKQNMAEAPEPSGLRTKLENLDNEGRGKKEIKWQSGFCSKCGAWYGQLGLEPTLDLYIEHLLQITAELKRVLKPTGVMFWNMGDNYSNQDTLLKEFSIEDEWLRLLGWIYTDGTVLRDGSRICIYQSKQRGITEIEYLLNKLGLKYTKYGPHKRNYQYYIHAKDSRKVNEILGLNGEKCLPSWLRFCSRRQIIIFLEAIISGDGSRRKYDTVVYGNKDKLEPLKNLLESKDISCKLYKNSRGDWLLQIHQELWNPKYYKEKSLCFQNYRLILRMIDEQGWILRNTIIWHKPNHMPSSVKDRFTNAYEPVFMLTKSKKYWFDLDAVRVPHKIESIKRAARARKSKKLDAGQYSTSYKNEYIGYDDLEGKLSRGELRGTHPLGKNPGDVWEISTEGFPEAHFATFPEKLVEPMIKAGCPQWICNKCGKPRERITKIERELEPHRKKLGIGHKTIQATETSTIHHIIRNYTLGWTDCGCNAGWHPGVVLDPFAGSGTTLYVARKLGRHYLGIELNPEYVKMAQKRLAAFGERLEKFIELEESP